MPIDSTHEQQDDRAQNAQTEDGAQDGAHQLEHVLQRVRLAEVFLVQGRQVGEVAVVAEIQVAARHAELAGRVALLLGGEDVGAAQERDVLHVRRASSGHALDA